MEESFYERVESVQGIGHALRNRKDEREKRKAVFVHLLFFSFFFFHREPFRT